jgi:hypothetical protein
MWTPTFKAPWQTRWVSANLTYHVFAAPSPRSLLDSYHIRDANATCSFVDGSCMHFASCVLESAGCVGALFWGMSANRLHKQHITRTEIDCNPPTCLDAGSVETMPRNLSVRHSWDVHDAGILDLVCPSMKWYEGQRGTSSSLRSLQVLKTPEENTLRG